MKLCPGPALPPGRIRPNFPQSQSKRARERLRYSEGISPNPCGFVTLPGAAGCVVAGSGSLETAPWGAQR